MTPRRHCGRALRWTAALAAALLAAGPAPGDGGVSLAPAGDSAGDPWPYRLGRLTVDNPTDRPAVAVTLTPADGGPTVRLPLRLPPGGRTRLDAPLPAVRLHQTYRIGLLAASAGEEVLAERRAEVSWPADRLSDQAFFDPGAFDTLDATEPPTWPASARWRAWGVAVLATVVLAGVLLVPPGVWRATALAGAVAATTALAGSLATPTTTAQQRRFTAWNDPNAGYVALAVRRTETHTLPADRFFPVYYSINGFRADRCVIQPGGDIRVRVRPTWVRVFRRRADR